MYLYSYIFTDATLLPIWLDQLSLGKPAKGEGS